MTATTVTQRSSSLQRQFHPSDFFLHFEFHKNQIRFLLQLCHACFCPICSFFVFLTSLASSSKTRMTHSAIALIARHARGCRLIAVILLNSLSSLLQNFQGVLPLSETHKPLSLLKQPVTRLFTRQNTIAAETPSLRNAALWTFLHIVPPHFIGTSSFQGKRMKREF